MHTKSGKSPFWSYSCSVLLCASLVFGLETTQAYLAWKLMEAWSIQWVLLWMVTREPWFTTTRDTAFSGCKKHLSLLKHMRRSACSQQPLSRNDAIGVIAVFHSASLVAQFRLWFKIIQSLNVKLMQTRIFSTKSLSLWADYMSYATGS